MQQNHSADQFWYWVSVMEGNLVWDWRWVCRGEWKLKCLDCWLGDMDAILKLPNKSYYSLILALKSEELRDYWLFWVPYHLQRAFYAHLLNLYRIASIIPFLLLNVFTKVYLLFIYCDVEGVNILLKHVQCFERGYWEDVFASLATAAACVWICNIKLLLLNLTLCFLCLNYRTQSNLCLIVTVL